MTLRDNKKMIHRSQRNKPIESGFLLMHMKIGRRENKNGMDERMNGVLTNLQVHLMQRKYPCGLRNGFQFSPTSFLTSLKEHCFGVSVTTTKKVNKCICFVSVYYCFVVKAGVSFIFNAPLQYLQSAVISFCRRNLVQVYYLY